MGSTEIVWSIRIGWSTNLTSLFRIAASTLGSGDYLDGAFGASTYEDVTGVCYGFEAWRGRNQNMGLQKGTGVLYLDDPNGRYNPENAASPLAGLLVPLRPVVITATHLSTDYGVWYSYIERIEHDPDRDQQQTAIYCVDLLEWLESLKPTIAAMGATNTGAAIGEVLDAMEWTASSMRDLDTGDSIPDFSADGTESGVALIEGLLAVERGTFFPNGSGVAKYTDRTACYKAGSVAATVTAGYLDGVKPSSDLRTIVNSQTVTRTGGTAQTATDTTSRQKYGWRHGSPITSTYLANDTQALHLAQHIVAMGKDPRGKTFGVKLKNLDDTNTTQQLTRELGDLVTVTEDSGTSVTGYIEAIKHTLRGALLETEWLISKRTVELFTIAVSRMDSGHVLAF